MMNESVWPEKISKIYASKSGKICVFRKIWPDSKIERIQIIAGWLVILAVALAWWQL